MLNFHIAIDFGEILSSFIYAKYKIVGIGFITTDIRRNSVPYRSSEMCHFICTNAIPPNFITNPILIWPIILNQIIQQTGYFL
jgi:uncharacterized membrane protein